MTTNKDKKDIGVTHMGREGVETTCYREATLRKEIDSNSDVYIVEGKLLGFRDEDIQFLENVTAIYPADKVYNITVTHEILSTE